MELVGHSANLKIPAKKKRHLFYGSLPEKHVRKAMPRDDVVKPIPFDDIVAWSTVRLAEIENIQYLSIRDIIMHVCDKDCHDAAQIWRRMGDDEVSELSQYLKMFQFPGRGQQTQPVITLPGSIKLVMILPGEQAKRYKWIFAGIISRYLDGDDEMCLEIKENKSMGKKRSYEKFAQDMDRSIKEEFKKKNPSIGYVYATQSEAFPGLVKIGQTTDMKARLSQLNTACAPAPHVVVALAPTFDMQRDERDAHEFFSPVRMQGEFFAANKSQVKKYFFEHIMALHQEELLEYMQ